MIQAGKCRQISWLLCERESQSGGDHQLKFNVLAVAPQTYMTLSYA